MQNQWQLKLDWNEQLPSTSLRECEEFLNKLTEINHLIIRRYVLLDNIAKLELHGFKETSGKIYGVAIYLRCLVTTREFSSNLLCSKFRAPPSPT